MPKSVYGRTTHTPRLLGDLWDFAAPTDSWVDDALCTQVDPDLFYPSGKGEARRRMERQAIVYCRGCPVRPQCLEHALAVPQVDDHGVWAGTTPEERAVIRERRAR